MSELVGANLGIGQTNQPNGPALAAIFFGLRRVLRPADRAGLRVADGLGQHLAQLSLGLGWCPRDRCLPVSHGCYVGMPERELNPAGDLKNQRSSDGLPKDIYLRLADSDRTTRHVPKARQHLKCRQTPAVI
jgi:hypothetical protein